jgi:hypothetical protein
LYSIWKVTGEERIYSGVSKYYKFYLDHLFKDKTIPKITPRNIYPVDIHSCAEAILCNSLVREDFPQAKEYLQNSINWTIENMQDKSGYFYYRKLPHRTIKIPYIRWGQAWMLRALSEHITPP